VELLYEQADQAPPNYIDHIYRHDLETQLEKTTAELIGWLSNWVPVVHQQHQQLLKQQQLQLEQQHHMLQQQPEQQEPQQELQQEQPQSQQQSQQSQAPTNTMHSATRV
jgi:hypothetical protein